jgi:hypothetical protein
MLGVNTSSATSAASTTNATCTTRTTSTSSTTCATSTTSTTSTTCTSNTTSTTMVDGQNLAPPYLSLMSKVRGEWDGSEMRAR